MLIAVYGLIVLVFLAVAVRRPERGFDLYLLLAPFNYFYVWAFGWSVSWTLDGGVGAEVPPSVKYFKDLVLVLLLLVWLGRRRRLPLRGLDGPVLAFLALLVVMAVPTLLLDGVPLAATALWQNAGAMTFYFVYKEAGWSRERVRTRLLGLLVLACTVAGLGLLQWATGTGSLFEFRGAGDVGIRRAISTLGSPNSLGLFLDLGLAVLLARWDSLPRGLRWTALGLIPACLLATFSMTTYLVAAALFLAWAGLRRRVVAGLAGVALGVVAVTAGLQVADVARDRLGGAAQGGDQSFSDRLEAWSRIAGEGSPAQLALGHGTGRGGAMTVAFQDKNNLLADNQYLAELGQLGLVGLTAFLLVLGLAVARCLATGGPGGWRAPGVAILAVFSVFFLTGNYLNSFPGNLVFWATLGLVMAPSGPAGPGCRRTPASAGTPSAG